MNKIYYFLFLSLLLGACTKEDALEPTGANDDYFTVPATATDPESVMRREFYEETGVHLLFNDTLRRGARLRMGIRAGTRKPWTSAIR